MTEVAVLTGSVGSGITSLLLATRLLFTEPPVTTKYFKCVLFIQTEMRNVILKKKTFFQVFEVSSEISTRLWSTLGLITVNFQQNRRSSVGWSI